MSDYFRQQYTAMTARIVREAREQLLVEAMERDDRATLLERLPRLCRDVVIAYHLCRQAHRHA